MRAKMCLAALAVSASLAEAAIAEHEVESLPGWDYALPSKQYSGFISAQDPATVVPGKERFLHYILVLAENNPADAPVVLWSNGGPGCSSLEGYLMEMGPLTPDPSDPQAQRLKRNPYTWNLYANMLCEYTGCQFHCQSNPPQLGSTSRLFLRVSLCYRPRTRSGSGVLLR